MKRAVSFQVKAAVLPHDERSKTTTWIFAGNNCQSRVQMYSYTESYNLLVTFLEEVSCRLRELQQQMWKVQIPRYYIKVTITSM